MCVCVRVKNHERRDHFEALCVCKLYDKANYTIAVVVIGFLFSILNLTCDFLPK